MMILREISILLLLVFYYVNCEQLEGGECITTFQELERSVIGKDANINSMADGFYPTNRQPSLAVNVYYFLGGLQMISRQNLDVSSYDYAFRWSTSWVFAVIRPNLLQYLSLFVYHDHTTTIKIIIDPVCGANPPQSSLDLLDETKTCSEGANSSDFEMLLNKLTTQLKSYILDNRLLGIDEQSRAYSSWFFKRNNTNDHCVIGESDSYKRFRIAVAAIMMTFPVIVILTVPFLIVNCYEKLHEESKKKGSNVQYYLWAVVITMVLFDVAVVAFDAVFIIKIGLGKRLSAVTDVKWYYYLSSSYVIALPLSDYFITLMLVRGLRTDLEIVKNSISCPMGCSTFVFLTDCFWIAAAVLMVQLVCFHGYFVALALFAAPIHTCSFLLIYAAGIFGFVFFIAIILKAIHFRHIVFALFGTALFLFIMLLIVAVKELMILVGEHRNGGVVLSIVSSFAPGILLPVTGYCGKKVLEMFVGESSSTRNSEGVQRHNEAVTRNGVRRNSI